MVPTARVLIEIDRDSVPISGLARRLDGHAAARRFSGYMELIAVLEQLAAAER